MLCTATAHALWVVVDPTNLVRIAVSVFCTRLVGSTTTHCAWAVAVQSMAAIAAATRRFFMTGSPGDRKSTRLNSSHQIISYAVFCLKKKNATHHPTYPP